MDNCVRQHLNGAGLIPTGSVGRDLNLQKLNYQYLTTSVAVVLGWYKHLDVQGGGVLFLDMSDGGGGVEKLRNFPGHRMFMGIKTRRRN